MNRKLKFAIDLVYSMPVQQIQTPYPVIDTDPKFTRVVRYFRPSDYAAWAVGTAVAPAAIYGFGMVA